MYYSYNGINYATMADVNIAILSATGLPSINGINKAFGAAAGTAGMPMVSSDDKAATAASKNSSVIAAETQLHQNEEATVKESANGTEAQDGAGQVFN